MTPTLGKLLIGQRAAPCLAVARAPRAATLQPHRQACLRIFGVRCNLSCDPPIQGHAHKIDVAESKDAIEVTAELPGVDEKDVDVTLADDVLTIRGEKKSEREERDKEKNWHVVERSYGSFSRAIPLPFEADPTKVEAKFDNGVLRIHLPKPEDVTKKEQKIEIKKT